MMKYIEVTDEAKKELERIFDVTRQAIWQALTFKSNSEIARKIRHVAVTQKGGRVYRIFDITDGFIPNCKTLFERKDGEVSKVVSIFEGGVKCVYDCDADTAVLIYEGKEIRKYWNVNSGGWYRALLDAEQLSVAN